MPWSLTRGVLVSAIAVVATARCVDATDAGAVPALRSAEDVVRAAVIERLGQGVDVSISATGVSGAAPVFRDARPDPSAWLGKPVRFTLVTGTGTVVPVSVVLTVIGDRVVARHEIARGRKLTADDLESVHGEIANVPMRRLPTAVELVGAKALRPMDAGTTVLPGFVLRRRAVEPGDRVTATAAGGAVEVTAEFTAADGGAIGDVIRVVNPETKRFVRGRIVKEGLVEVVDGR